MGTIGDGCMVKDISKNLDIAQDIVNQRFSIADDLYGTMFLVCYGLIANYGDVYEPIIRRLIRTTELFIADRPLTELLDEGGYGGSEYLQEENLDNDYFSTAALSFAGDDYWFEDGAIRYYRNRPNLFCSTTGMSYTEMLNAIIHEFGHLLKSSINYINTDNSTHFTMRSGIHIFGGKVDESGQLHEFSEHQSLDEVINVFQTRDAMREIAKLEGVILPEVVQVDFDKLDSEQIDDLYGYEACCIPMIPLWENEHFRGIVSENIIIGKLDRIRNDFNEMVGRNYFNMLSRHLNLIEYADDEEEVKNLTSFINTIVRIYNLRSKSFEKKKD